jgi:hypothetical protein
MVLLAIPFVSATASSVNGQAVLNKPTIQKSNPIVLKIPNLAILDLAGMNLNSVYVQVGNVGTGKAGVFYVRLSLKKKGSTTKTYIEKRVAGLDADADIPLYIDIGQPVADLEIGVFVDARKQIAESEELNCGKLFPGGGVVGLQPCKDF